MTDLAPDATRQSLPRMFLVPTALAIVSGVGLVSALLGDGPWDALSWLTLAAPVAVPLYCIVRGRS
jgi:hypothetical protein